MDGVSVYDAGIEDGRALACRHPVEADVVTGVPDSGLVAAGGETRAVLDVGATRTDATGRVHVVNAITMAEAHSPEL